MREPRQFRNYENLAILGGAGIVAGLGGALYAGFAFAKKYWQWPDGLFGFWQWILHTLSAVGVPVLEPSVWALWPDGQWLMVLQAATAFLAAAWGFLIGWLVTTPPPAKKHIRGRTLLEGEGAVDAASVEAKKEFRASGPGVHIHPGIRISLERETRHFLVLGATGAGKTTVIYPLMREAINRGDKLFIFDYKGDFTSCINGEILAPWDARGIAWDIAADMENRADVETLAASLIPQTGNDPMWSNGARQILVGIVLYLMSEKDGWDFADIIATACLQHEQLLPILERHNSLAGAFMKEKTKTTDSFSVVLLTYMSTIQTLADYWSGKVKISMRAWVRDQIDEPQKRVLLCQANDRYSTLSEQYISAVINLLSSILNSPETPDSTERKLWLFLDEFPQLGKVEKVKKFLEVGRSKGVRCVLGLQDAAQVEETYTVAFLRAVSSMVGTYILGRTGGVETAKWLSQMVGERTVERWTQNRGEPGLGQEANISGSFVREKEDILSPDEISTRLGAVKGGIKAVLLTGGDNVYLLKWPWVKKEVDRTAVVPIDFRQLTLRKVQAARAEAPGGGLPLPPPPPKIGFDFAETAEARAFEKPFKPRGSSQKTPVAPSTMQVPPVTVDREEIEDEDGEEKVKREAALEVGADVVDQIVGDQVGVGGIANRKRSGGIQFSPCRIHCVSGF